MIAAVLGASGFVGRAVTAELTRQGHTVMVVPAPRLRSTAKTVEELLEQSRRMDAEVQQLAKDLAGADVVINAAGLAAPGDPESAELTGANALLPVLLAQAVQQSTAHRFLHLSSSAVQGHSSVLDESTRTAPFSAYSRSKDLGEQGVLAVSGSTVIIRATSVQGEDRPTTMALVRIASSRLASVAAPGTAPTPVSSISALAAFVVHASTVAEQPPAVVLQPWEGATTTSVLRAAGGREPFRIPRGLCTFILRAGYGVSTLLGERLHGVIRRVELMWFGQGQQADWAAASGFTVNPAVGSTLERARAKR